MSTNKTQHYGLHAWEPEDSVIRTEFNENFAALDTALHARAQAHTALEATVATKATQADLNSLKTTVSTKAAQTDLDALKTTVSTKAAQSDLNSLKTTVNAKAAQTDLNSLKTTVSNLTTTVNGKASVVAGSYTATDSDETLTFTLGFQPVAVHVEHYTGSRTSNGVRYGGLALPGYPLDQDVTITSTGFTVTRGANYGTLYYYIAFR